MCIYIFTYNTYTGILAIKRMKYNAICSNLEIILSEISQRKTNIISLTCEIFKKMIQINLFIKQKKNHRHRKKTYGSQSRKEQGGRDKLELWYNQIQTIIYKRDKWKCPIV